MIKWLEKWALKRLLKRVAENLPIAQDRIGTIWAENSNEIFEKVTKTITDTITKVIKKALEKQGVEISDISDN